MGDVRKSERLESIRTSQAHTIYDWFHVGEHYIYEWLAEQPPPSNDEGPASRASSPPLPPKLSQDKDVDMTLTNAGSTLNMGSGTTPAINPVSEEGAVAVATAQMAGSPDAVTGS